MLEATVSPVAVATQIEGYGLNTEREMSRTGNGKDWDKLDEGGDSIKKTQEEGLSNVRETLGHH
jgi:hypothetical protein